jgi:hypothetical protein
VSVCLSVEPLRPSAVRAKLKFLPYPALKPPGDTALSSQGFRALVGFLL